MNVALVREYTEKGRLAAMLRTLQEIRDLPETSDPDRRIPE